VAGSGSLAVTPHAAWRDLPLPQPIDDLRGKRRAKLARRHHQLAAVVRLVRHEDELAVVRST
jgi:hypothetical protein